MNRFATSRSKKPRLGHTTGGHSRPLTPGKGANTRHTRPITFPTERNFGVPLTVRFLVVLEEDDLMF